MNIDDLTIKQVRELQSLVLSPQQPQSNGGLPYQMGKKVIIRTYSAGVWYGTLSQKEGNEVVLVDARRLWSWWAAESISLSGVAVYGIKQDKSQIAPKVDGVWLEAIEIIPTTETAQKSIESAKDAKAS